MIEGIVEDIKESIEFKSPEVKLTDQHTKNLEYELQNLRTRIESANVYALSLEDEINKMRESLAWKLISKYRNFNNRWFSCGTKRRRIVDRMAASLNSMMGEELGMALQDVFKTFLNILRGRSFFNLDLNEQYRIWLRNNELTEDKISEMRRKASEFAYHPKISVIMPVYNTKEELLRLAIDSIIKQT